MSANQKICGILIENSVNKAMVKESVVGIGLNVNQKLFDKLPNAISMVKISNKKYDLDELLNELIKSIEKYVRILSDMNYDYIDKGYFKNLYKYNVPTMFQSGSEVFMAKIIDVSKEGKLKLELDDETVISFDMKEIEYLN